MQPDQALLVSNLRSAASAVASLDLREPKAREELAAIARVVAAAFANALVEDAVRDAGDTM